VDYWLLEGKHCCVPFRMLAARQPVLLRRSPSIIQHGTKELRTPLRQTQFRLTAQPDGQHAARRAYLARLSAGNSKNSGRASVPPSVCACKPSEHATYGRHTLLERQYAAAGSVCVTASPEDSPGPVYTAIWPYVTGTGTVLV
jgi:hypothetical protein